MKTRRTSTTRNALTIGGCCVAMLAACAATAPRPGNADLQRQVADTERAFAQTMADRNHAAFVTFLSSEAVFFTGPKPLHGKDEVAAAWKRFYEKPDAPFSWAPDSVEVLASGTLAISSGPVTATGSVRRYDAVTGSARSLLASSM